MCPAIKRQAQATYGLNRSPTRDAFQHTPAKKNAKKKTKGNVKGSTSAPALKTKSLEISVVCCAHIAKHGSIANGAVNTKVQSEQAGRCCAAVSKHPFLEMIETQAVPRTSYDMIVTLCCPSLRGALYILPWCRETR